jgi:hypothetical protein
MSELDTRKSIHDGQDSSQTCRKANNINLLTLPEAVLSRTARLVRMPGASRSGVVGSALEVDHTPFIVNPSEGVRATNNSSPHPVISINGMNMTDKSIRDMGQSFSDFFGRPTLMIPNHTDGAQIDIRNCILSAFSSKNGFRYEPHAAHNLVHVLLGRLNDPFPIEINAYSQGTLITCNVLNELKSYFTQHGRPDLWDSLANRIELRTYGAPVHRWPSELQVKELRHVSDPVSLIGDVISFKCTGSAESEHLR